MKVSISTSLTEHNEIVGYVDTLTLSILRNTSTSKTKGTWYTIRTELLPKEEAKEEKTHEKFQKIDSRNMAFGPSGEWSNAAPLWSEDLLPQCGLEKHLRSAARLLGGLTTTGQLLETLHHHGWFQEPAAVTSMTQYEREESERIIAELRSEVEAVSSEHEIKTPLLDKAIRKDRADEFKRDLATSGVRAATQNALERKMVSALLSAADMPKEQVSALLSGDYTRIESLRERAHREGRVKGRISIRIPNWILDAQTRKPISLSAPECFLRQDGEHFALVLFRGRFCLVTTPYVVPASAEEASLKVMKLVYADEGRLKRLKQQVKAMERAGSTANHRQAIPDDVKELVFTRDDGKCVRCGSSENLHYDHIIPLAKGGGSTEHNIQLLCEHCNLRKSDSIAF